MDKIHFENMMREKDKSYSELFAKAMLAVVYNPNFAFAQNDECPDIKLNYGNSSMGVEVTRLICSYFVTLKKYVKAWSRKRLSIEEIVKQIPYELQASIGINAAGKVVPLKSLGEKIGMVKMKKQLAHLYETKLEKLQNYELFNKNGLFMFATELNPNFTSHKILSTFMNKVDKSKYPIKYDNIFVFTYNKLFVYEMENGHYSTLEIPISEELIALCDKYARYSKKQNMDYLLKPQPKAEMEK